MTDMGPAIGLIARADNRGLGQQTWAFYRNMKPAKTLVIDCPSQQPLPLHLERYPGAEVVGIPTVEQLKRFLDGLDVVYTAETGYTQQLWEQAAKAGVKTVLHMNFEFWDTADRPDVWALPTPWNANHAPEGAVLLPVPIETDRLHITRYPLGAATKFLHIVGRPAIHDRNGTGTLLKALKHIKSEISLTIRCQVRGHVESMIKPGTVPDNVKLEVVSEDSRYYWDNYRDFHALVMPRRFGGLCLPAQEALGAGMPVIMPNVCPNHALLPHEWLVPATLTGQFQAKQMINPVSYTHLRAHET